MRSIRRGLSDIRTTTQRRQRAGVSPYRSYMRVSCLEMERVRLTTEKNNAQQRIHNIDARLVEIDAEKHALLSALNENPSAPASVPAAAAPAQTQESWAENSLVFQY